MEQLGTVAKNSVTAGLPKQLDGVEARRLLMIRQRAATLPMISRTLPDIEIPRRCWDAWHEYGKPRYLVRPLTEDERTVLCARRDELAPYVAPYHPDEADLVMVALADMLNAMAGGMAYSDEQAITKLRGGAQHLAEFPLWAIEARCEKIARRGYVRKDGDRYVTEKRWPPSDPELCDLVREEVVLYADSYRNAVALLAATVAPRE